jgi:hypothetical protein
MPPVQEMEGIACRIGPDGKTMSASIAVLDMD